jgi:hypothetical protein
MKHVQKELVKTYGSAETATLIKEYAQIKGSITGDICIGDLHDFPAFLWIARNYIDRQGPII